jgi:TetR/AcrR family fatty acid metabolism transcriptional regulator
MRKNDNRQAILDAALSTFVARGYHETTVSEISHKAGLAEGTLYNYFPSKENILLALFDETWGSMIGEMRQKIDRVSDPNDKLKAIFTYLARLFRRDRDLAEIFLVDVKQSSLFLNNFTVNRIIEFLDLIEEILIEGKKLGVYRADMDTTVTRMIIFGAAQGIMLGWVLKDTQAADRRVRSYSMPRAGQALKAVFKEGINV